jgi:hypothetical protein
VAEKPKPSIMKGLNQFGILCSMFLIGSPHAWAQIKPVRKDSATKKSSHWIADLPYQSNDVYLGRRDSVSVPYITPSIGYHDRSGLFLTGSFSYLPKAGMSRIDVVTIEGGYSYTSDGLSAGISDLHFKGNKSGQHHGHPFGEFKMPQCGETQHDAHGEVAIEN